MTSSLVLLMLLQALWLRGVYRTASEDFQKETNSLFRHTVVAMHDSLIRRSIEPVNSANSEKVRKQTRIFMNDSVLTRLPDAFLNSEDRITRIEIVATAPIEDSIHTLLRPLATRMLEDKNPQTFILRLGADSLRVDSIEFYYRVALRQAGIDAPFKVLPVRNERISKTRKTLYRSGESFTSDIVMLGPSNRFVVTFDGINGLLVREIAPQFLFSIFVTLLIGAAFYVMYRNLNAQRELMKIKNDFISNVTHELKTPVATVSVALEALRNFNVLDDRARTTEYLNIAQTELNRLTLMTDKILKTAVFENQGIDIKFENVDLGSLIQEVLTSMKLVFEKRKTDLNYEKNGNDFMLNGSRAHLTNVVYNLLDNALKYSPESSVLRIALKDTPKNLVLSVCDSGIGIAPEYQRRIFDKFFRVPSGDVHNTKGYGLGLSYVSSVVKSHGGKIEVESEDAKGSCFEITLPRKHEDPDTLR